ncbi:S-layer homology domain-containing protein [Lutispora sp.]|uniref:S-layer homology domain-containing protein n=1 Tax=Lutispora sp. TaxID=2828727 RepID=UPI002B21CD2B|nr:S-layer homology domain-containing protein [Lutispora sp.]MEA4961002.1 S-layer homology domain-containing protein [Lutispora sp.]
MKRMFKKTISMILAIAISVSMMPLAEVHAAAAEAEIYTLKNNYIEAVVSTKNGGFLIRTVEGNKMNKDDNNKNLLYHNGQYDTSFTSFKVDYGSNVVREYIFGGKYGFLGLSSSDVKVTQDTTGITAVWSVNDLTFTQRIELSALNSNEHGMTSISYTVKNNGQKPINSVKARVLLDSCLGNRDYGYYQIPVDGVGTLETITKEKVFDYGPNAFVPAAMYAIDDAMTPAITAYTVNSTSPYRIAFGHWNNLASSLFDFAPDTALEFTNAFNDRYLTADSAYALYYDMKDIAANAERNISTYYGVYSNHTVYQGDKVTVNVTAPTSLQLSKDKKSYVSSELALGSANIGVEAKINNFIKDAATDYSEISVAIYTPNGVAPLDAGGNDPGGTYSYMNPYRITLNNVEPGQTRATTFQLKADVGAAATFRKIEIRAFDTSVQSALTEQSLLGSSSFYILCPGGDGNLPKITFTGGEPDILYYEGTRHFFVTGNNFSMLEDKSLYTLYLESLTDKNRKYLVEPENITFPENPEGNILDVILKQNVPVGDYQLVFYWEDAAVKKGIVEAENKVMTAPALKVTMSDDPFYKNDTYGVVIVYQKPGTWGHTSAYEIKSFRNEAEFQKFKSAASNYKEILIILRGAFEVDTKDEKGNPVSWTAAVGKSSLVNGKVNQNTIVTLNNCIDFENGTLTLHYDGNNLSSGSILVDFDGDLYTSDARTSIWKGKAALTAITNGKDFSLVPYDEDGAVLKTFADETITLVWPCALSMAQTLSGMVFNMTYGKLGAMFDTQTYAPNIIELGRVLSFSGNMDLSFLVPSGAASKGCDTKWNRIKDAFNINNDYYGLRTRYERFVEEPSEKEQEDMKEGAGQASVMVDNILFGCGVGFVGFKCEVGVKLPSYTESMPTMNCKLKINTIGDWDFEVEGSCKFTTIEVELEIGIKSKNNIPVPDKLIFIINGFEPGINVDGSGVLWITGGGGGFDNLYDTIFVSSKLPPLKILLSVSFDIVKILSGRVDMSLGLRGLSLSASNIKIKFTDIMALEKAGLQFDWYPDWYFQASIKMSLLGIINGAGYIVVIDNALYDKFFEFFVRAGISVPSYIPIVGGFDVGGVDLGINKEKLWGVARIIGIKFGVVYYWDGDFDWGTGAGSTSPTFPELLGYESVPVYHDAESGETLYMAIGTNLNVLAMPEIGGNLDSAPKLLGTGATLKSAADKKTHELNLGAYAPSGEVFTITYDASDLEDAKTKATAMTIKDGVNDYGIVLGTNANITFDPAKGKGTFAVSATEPSQYNKKWSINTVVPADIVLFGVSPMPEITDVSQAILGSSATVNWAGTQLDKLDRLDFYLTTDDGTDDEIKDMGTLIGSLDNNEIIGAAGNTATFALPGTLQTGDYYLKAIFTKEGAVNGSKTSTGFIHYTNAMQPEAPAGVIVGNGGDSTLKVSVGNNTNMDYDAYVLNVYEKKDGDWVLSDVNGMINKKQEQVDEYGNATGVMLPVTDMSIGGSYSGFDQNGAPTAYGLTGGKCYKVGVTAVRSITDASGNHLYSVSSQEILSPEIVLSVPTPPVITIQNTSPFISVDRSEWGKGGSRITRCYDTLNADEVIFKAGSDVLVTGNWDIDGDYNNNYDTASSGRSGAFSDTASIEISLKNVPDGDHTLTVWGTDADGDSFRVQKVFTIDTQPPKLLITSPLNGGYYTEAGALNISGVTDRDAQFSIIIDGKASKPEHRDKTIAELGGTIDSDGVFSFDLNLDPGKSSHRILLLAKDKVGNFMQHEVTVKNKGLANIESVDLYMSDGASSPVRYSNKNLPISLSDQTIAQFFLVANTKNGRQIIIEDASMVDWNAMAVNGEAFIDSNGILTAGTASMGYVTGGLKVAALGSMTAAATFGAESYNSTFSVVVGSTVGGTVMGGGYYKPGDMVTIKAIPHPDYIFKGWIVKGASLAGNGATTTFMMPFNNVTVTAEFAHVSDPGTDSGSDSSSDTYGGSANKTPQAAISVKKYAAAGEVVTMVLPDLAKGDNPDLYIPYYIDSDGNEVPVPFSISENGKIIFIAPVNAIYLIKKKDCSFSDTKGHWGEKAILFAGARGLFMGVGNEKFNPEGKLNRAMLVTVLYRLAGEPASLGTNFSDVAKGTWYTDAVAWASHNGLVKGYNSKKFGPLDEITREQLAVILYRYKSMIGKDNSAYGNISSFKDSDKVSSWAGEAMEWAAGTGIIQGSAGLLNPGGNATRAEASTMLMRFIKLVLLGKI